MRDEPEVLRITEFRELRATIRERGTLRLTVTSITFSVWAAAILTVCGLQIPILSLVPLVLLAVGFELTFAIHTGVERIGRYIQVHHEPAAQGGAVWEETAMRASGFATSSHPLLPVLHIAAAILNVTLAATVAGDPELSVVFPSEPDILIYAALHVLFIGRVLWAYRAAATQRPRDLAVFTEALRARRDPKP
jgi:hypothetical protein